MAVVAERPSGIEPGKRWSAVCEYTDRAGDEDLTRAANYLRFHARLLRGPGINTVLRRQARARQRVLRG